MRSQVGCLSHACRHRRPPSLLSPWALRMLSFLAFGPAALLATSHMNDFSQDEFGSAIWEISLVHAWRTHPLQPARGCLQHAVTSITPEYVLIGYRLHASSYSTLRSWESMFSSERVYPLLYFWIGACHTFFAGCNDGAIFLHTHMRQSLNVLSAVLWSNA